jgi:hypothetical protein
MNRHHVFLPAVSCLCGLLCIANLATGDSESGYTYWSRFKPGTFVAFRCSTTSGGTTQSMLKTFTLKQASSESVVLEYKESPLDASGQAVQARPPLFLATSLEFRESDEIYNDPDLFKSQLNIRVFSILKSSDATEVDAGLDDFYVKGIKLRAARTKLRFGAADTSSTVTVWLSDEIPGKVVKLLQEIEAGAGVYREEVMVADFSAIKATLDDIEKLRKSRKPVNTEVPGSVYVTGRFRFFDDIRNAIHDFEPVKKFMETLVPSNPNTDWSEVYKKASPFLERVQALKKHLDEDRQKAELELGAVEMEKLGSFLKQAALFADSILRVFIESMGYLSTLASGPPNYQVVLSVVEDMRSLEAEFATNQKNLQQEFKKLGETKVRYLR